MSTVAWILVVALVALAVVCVGLALSLRVSRARAARTEHLVSEARRAVRAAAEEEASMQSEQLRVAIARAQADSLSSYVAEERRLADQRRGELAVRERELSDRMAEVVASVEQRVEERLRAWESDLERAQNALQGAISTLEQRIRQRIAEVEGKVAAEADELDAMIDEHRVAATRLREELESSTRDALARALEELQTQADDRRRTIDELNEIEILYALERAAWGRGLATEAGRAALAFGFGEVRLARIIAVAHPENRASRAVMEKLGMRYEGYLEVFGAVLYALPRDEFHAARRDRA